MSLNCEFSNANLIKLGEVQLFLFGVRIGRSPTFFVWGENWEPSIIKTVGPFNKLVLEHRDIHNHTQNTIFSEFIMPT